MKKLILFMILSGLMISLVSAEMVSIDPVPITVDINPQLNVQLISTGGPAPVNVTYPKPNNTIIVKPNGTVVDMTGKTFRINQTITRQNYSVNATFQQVKQSYNETFVKTIDVPLELTGENLSVKEQNNYSNPSPVYEVENPELAKSLNSGEKVKPGEVRKLETENKPIPILHRVKSFLINLFS